MIAPHSLVYSGLRWHARAFCEKIENIAILLLTE